MIFLKTAIFFTQPIFTCKCPHLTLTHTHKHGLKDLSPLGQKSRHASKAVSSSFSRLDKKKKSRNGQNTQDLSLFIFEISQKLQQPKNIYLYIFGALSSLLGEEGQIAQEKFVLYTSQLRDRLFFNFL